MAKREGMPQHSNVSERRYPDDVGVLQFSLGTLSGDCGTASAPPSPPAFGSMFSSLILVSSLVFGSGLASATEPAAPKPFEPIAAPTTSAALVAAPRHELGQSIIFLRIYDDSLLVRVEVTTDDLESALGFGWDPDEVVLSDVRNRLDSIRAYVEPRFELGTAGGPIPLEFVRLDSLFLEGAKFVQLQYRFDGPWEIPPEIDVMFSVAFEFDTDHRNLVVIEHNWRTSTFTRAGEEGAVAMILSPRSPRQSLDLTSSTVLRGFIGFVWLGVWHIWIGIDHILFLLALALPAVLARKEGRWVPVESFRQALFNIVAIVSFFTIAHSVTLSLAALGVVNLPSRLVESIIAGSIAVAAWANLKPKLKVREWLIAFAFGLFHGFGFASVMGDIGVGGEFLVLSLLAFNIGVELGQIAIIALAFPILFLLRKHPIYNWILKIGSWFLIAVALLWFFERALDFNVPLGPILTAPFRAVGIGG